VHLQCPFPPRRQAPRRLPHRPQGHPEVPPGAPALELLGAVRRAEPHRHPAGKGELRPLALPPAHADRTRRPLPQRLPLVKALGHDRRIARPPARGHHPTVTRGARDRAVRRSHVRPAASPKWDEPTGSVGSAALRRSRTTITTRQRTPSAWRSAEAGPSGSGTGGRSRVGPTRPAAARPGSPDVRSSGPAARDGQTMGRVAGPRPPTVRARRSLSGSARRAGRRRRGRGPGRRSPTGAPPCVCRPRPPPAGARGNRVQSGTGGQSQVGPQAGGRDRDAGAVPGGSTPASEIGEVRSGAARRGGSRVSR
jgi:hypothetical protein